MNQQQAEDIIANNIPIKMAIIEDGQISIKATAKNICAVSISKAGDAGIMIQGANGTRKFLHALHLAESKQMSKALTQAITALKNQQ